MSTQNKYILALVIFIIIIILAAIFLTSSNLNRYNSTSMDMLISDSSDSLSRNKVLTNLYNQGNFSDLNKELDSQLLKSPNDFAILLQKAQALAQEASLTFKEKELGDQALIYIDKALAIDPESAEALTVKGYIYEIQQDYVNAHKYYDKALSIDSKFVNALAQKGHAYDLQGNYIEAEEHYAKAYSLNNNNEIALAGLGRIYIANGKIEEAEIFLNKIISISKNNRRIAETFNNLGLIYQRRRDGDKAIEYFKNSIATDPTFFQSYVGLAASQFDLAINSKIPADIDKNLTESFQNLEEALKIYPNSVYASNQLIMQLISTGENDLAKKMILNLKNKISKDITLDAKTKESAELMQRALTTLK